MRIPASVFYAALERHGPTTIDEIGLASRSYTMRMVAALRAAEKVHICGWRGIPGNWRMVLSAGPGIDAVRPALSESEARARKRASEARYWREKMEKKKALQKLQEPKPQLPKHTPTIGIWGI